MVLVTIRELHNRRYLSEEEMFVLKKVKERKHSHSYTTLILGFLETPCRSKKKIPISGAEKVHRKRLKSKSYCS